MARQKALQRTRIGSVPFLNALPLIYGMEDRVQFFPPDALSDEFDAGRIDMGLLPVVEYFKEGGRLLVPRIAIGSKGPVGSVKLFLNKPVGDLRLVAVDQRSRTSVLLLRVLLEKKYNLRPQYVAVHPGQEFYPDQYDGLLLIGDDALRYDKIPQDMDLGAEWTAWTGLPFVFACWQVKSGFSDSGTVEKLCAAAARGIDAIDHIVSIVPGYDAAFLRHYFTQCLCYEFGADQQRGIELFCKYLTGLDVPVRERKIEYYQRQASRKDLIRLAP